MLSAVAIAVPWLNAKNIDVSLTTNGIPATLVVVLLGLAIFTVIGVGIGALVRNQIAAVVGTLLLLGYGVAFAILGTLLAARRDIT